MKRLQFFFPGIFFLLFSSFFLKGQGVLHLIVSYDNYNQDIRQGCQKDFEKTNTFFKSVANDAGMGYRLHTLQFSQREVYNFFQQFRCGQEDAVVFIYSGHGFRQADDQVIWPFLYYCTANGGQDLSGCGVPLDWIHQALISKHPRMSITLGNSCNVVPGQENATSNGLERKDPDQPDASSLRNLDLLTKFRGHIIASGSSPGQFSYTNDDDGSYFVNELVEVMADGLLFAQHESSWASMLKKTRDEVQKKKPDQRPQFLIVQDKKRMYSEGAANYQTKPSYEMLGIEVPQVEDEGYENWEVEEFDDDDYAEEWESEFDAEDHMELALEYVPYVMLYGLQFDDGNLSQAEYDKARDYYLGLSDSFGYDSDSAAETFDDLAGLMREEQNNGTFKELFDDIAREFQGYLDPDTKRAVLESLNGMADNPENANFQNYLAYMNK